MGGGGRKEVGRGSGRCWMGWDLEGSLQKPDGVGAWAAETMNFGAEGPKFSLTCNAGDSEQFRGRPLVVT